MTNGNKGLEGTIVGLGLWMLIAPFILDPPTAVFWNDLVVGVAVASIAGFNLYRLAGGRAVVRGGAATNATLGAWLAIAPFLFDASRTALANDVLVGVAIATAGAYGWLAAGQPGPSTRSTRAS